MALTSEKPIAVLGLVILLCCSLVSAEFTLKSLTVSININQGGDASIEEQVEIMVNGSSSRDLYETTRSTYSDLSTWKNRTQLSEMRHHITRAKADIQDLRILPQAIERCNSFIGICHATVVLDYKVPASENGSGLIKVEKYKPRTSRYSLQQDALSFEQTKSKDLILPKGTIISIAIPQSAEKIYFSTVPSNLEDESEQSFRYDQSTNLRYYIGEKRVFDWQGETLSKFEFTYDVELPLESEVIEFFKDAQNSVILVFLGPEGLAAVIIIAAAAAAFYYFNRIGRK